MLRLEITMVPGYGTIRKNVASGGIGSEQRADTGSS